jgi:PAS domain S-box-containing protein
MYLGLISTSLAQTYRMESYNTQSGLLSDHINDIAQDQNGILWISTSKGLSTFDGLAFQNQKDSNNLFPISFSSRIKIVGVDQVVIVGFNAAFNLVGRYRQNSKWNNLAIPDSLNLKSKFIWDAALVENELHVRLVRNNILYSYSSLTNTWKLTPIPLEANNKYNKLSIRNNRTILLAQTGVYEEFGDRWKEIVLFNPDQQKSNPTEIIFDNPFDSLFWLAGHNWLAQSHAGQLTQLPISVTEADAKFQLLQKSNNGFLFFRSDKSFFWYHIKSNTFQPFLPLSSDIGVISSRIFVDKENGLWITSYRGLHHIPSFLFLGFGKEKGLLDTEVSVINELAPDKYLIGFKNGYQILKGDSIIYSEKISVWAEKNTRVINATKDKENIYLSGQHMGLGILASDFSSHWIPLKDTFVVDVKYLKDTLWVATNLSQLYFLKNKKLVKKSFLNGYPREISLLPDGSLLASTRSGARIISGSSVKEINNASNLLLKQIYCSFVDGDKIYLGTEGGLASIEEGMIKKGILHGKHIERAIYSVIKGREGYWFGTDNGIYLLKDTILTHYDESSGLSGWEINRGAFIEDQKGRLVIGTNKGLNFYDPLHGESKTLAFIPAIKWIRSPRNSFADKHEIELSYNDNFITIAMEAISFTGKPIEFRYRMNGYQSAWQYLSSSDTREVMYRGLPPGKFQFEFQARLGNSQWSKSILSHQINISTPFYRSNLFFFLLFIIAGGFGYLIRWLLSNQKLKEKLKQEIKQSLSELKKSETKLELALENSKMGVWMYYFDTDRAEFSREMFEILEINPNSEPLKRSTYLSIVHKDDYARVKALVNEALMERTPYDIELRVMIKDGTYRWIHVKGKARYKADGALDLLSGTMNDISHRKELEADRELMISELEKTNKELDRFIYSVSHDLSAPIKSIQGLINLTRMEQLTIDTNQYLNLIERSITRQNQFIKEIINYGRNNRTQIYMEFVDIEEVINNTVEDLKYSEYYASAEIHVRVDPAVKVVECDQIRIKIILNNLLSNAIKFKSKYKEKHIVSVAVFKTETGFGLTIEDNGIGIDAKHLDRLFTMFYRATDQQSGSGIGLYIAFEAAKKMNLSLTVSSKLGEGSLFSLK